MVEREWNPLVHCLVFVLFRGGVDGQSGAEVRACADAVCAGNPLGVGVSFDDRAGPGVEMFEELVEVVAGRSCTGQ